MRDAAEGLVLAMERGAIGHRYILGGESIALKRVLQLMAEIASSPAVVSAIRALSESLPTSIA